MKNWTLLIPHYISIIACFSGIVATTVAHADVFSVDKECSGNSFKFKVTQVERRVDETRVTLRSTGEPSGIFNAPGSRVVFHLVSLDNKIDLEIIDIEGIKFGDEIDPKGKPIELANAMIASDVNNSNVKYDLREMLAAISSETAKRKGDVAYMSRLNNLQVVLVFPSIPSSLKRFHVREIPVDKSDWSCNNIKLE